MTDRLDIKGNVPDRDMAERLGIGQHGHRLRGKFIIGGTGTLALAIVLSLAFRGGSTTQYVTQLVTRGPLFIMVSATGTLAPRDQVDVGAEVSGRLDAVNVDFNDHVKKGEVLAQINTDQLRAQLAQANAQLATAKATVLQDSQTLKRYRALYAKKAISPQDYDNAKADLARAEASVELAQAQVAQFKTQIGKATIRAPIDGVVLDRKVEPGQTVIAAMQTPVLFTLASDLSEMELDVDIDEADVGQVRAGQDATFSVDAYPSQTFSAKLVSVHNSPQTVNGVVTYQGVLLLKNPNGLLKPGMTATAEIEAAHVKNATLVPNGALRFTPAKEIADKAKKLPQQQNGAIWGRVWMVNGKSITPEDLRLGATNGKDTQVLSGGVPVGGALATDIKAPSDGTGGSG